jgi:uncharacterized protein YjdB
VRPVAGLVAGNYVDTIPTTGINGASSTVRVEFKVEDTFTITAEPSPLQFGNEPVGYAQPASKTVIITNTGTGSVTLNQLTALTNYVISTLQTTPLASGATATFTVRPVAGLVAGNYDETITITGSNGASATINVSFEVVVMTIPVTGIELDRTYYLFFNGPGGTLQLTAKITPDDATNKAVTWSSSNEAVASVDVTGFVTAVSPGYTLITVTTDEGGYTATCRIYVNSFNIGDMIPLKPELPRGTPASIRGSSVVSAEPLIFIPADSSDALRKVDMIATIIPDINSTDLYANQFGVLIVQDWIAEKIAEKLLSVDKAEAIPIPVFEAELNSPGEIAALSFQVKGRHLMVDGLISRPENVRLMNILSTDSGDFYTYVGTAAELKDKTFTILDMDGNIFTGNLDPADDYKLLFLIKDGGSFDLDKQEDGAVWGILSFIAVRVTGVELATTTLTIPFGNSYNLSDAVVITPAIADNKTVTWSSIGSSLRINQSGLVTTMGIGSGTIIVTTNDGGHIATCYVTVIR